MNCNHSLTSTSLVLRITHSSNCDLILLTEPQIHNITGTFSVTGWNSLISFNHKSAIFVHSSIHFTPVLYNIPNLSLISLQCNNNLDILIGYLYLSPNENLSNSFSQIKLHFSPTSLLLLVGNFNANTYLILHNQTDSFGSLFEELVFSLTLSIHNNSQPTFHRRQCYKILDYVFPYSHLTQ